MARTTATATRTKDGLFLRWIIRRDMAEVMGIERQSFGNSKMAWTEEEYAHQLKSRNVIGLVVEGDRERIVGLMLYEMHRDSVEIVRLAVLPAARRQGVGRAMLDKIASKLGQRTRAAGTMAVPERNLAAQLFLRACGWRGEQAKAGWINFKIDLSTMGERVIERILSGDCRVK